MGITPIGRAAAHTVDKWKQAVHNKYAV